MKIAVACMGTQVGGHFGHCENFRIYDTADGKICAEESIPNPGHRPGFLTKFLGDMGVEVIKMCIRDSGHSGEEAEEGVAVLAGLHDDGIAAAHPVAGVEQRQRAADHHCGILLGSQEDVGAHGGGGGLAVDVYKR